MSRGAHPAGPRHGDVLPADHPPAAPADLNALYEGIWPRGARRQDGVLRIGGMDVRDLAAEFGTPLYVCDEEDVRSRCRDYLEAFGPDARVFYAAKAFCSRAVLRWVSSEGLGVDVCTGGELEVALSAGVPPEQITMHGNNKTTDELSRAISAGVGHIVADSFEEIARLAYLTDPVPGGPPSATPKPNVLVRVTTGVEAHTHEFMATAHDDQKFGFSLASGAADEAVRRVIALPGCPSPGCTRTSARRSSTRPGSRWPRTGWSTWPSGSATSTASRSPSSTWAAGSASPTPRRTTPPRSRTWPRACAGSSDAQCQAAGLPGRG